ncbi:MAG: DUF3179 domain-containing protein [Cyclobacteriaceae bacterium]
MKNALLLPFILLILGCSEESDPGTVSDADWLIERTKVFDGGPGKDGIPALDNPEMAPIGSAGLDYLTDSDLVLVYENNGEVKAYSHPVLDWHEIINDQIGDDFVGVTYCPLTGTGIGWGREINGEITTFGVSGLLFETNLMPFDRLTESYWSQMANQCVKGELISKRPDFFNLTQMSYGSLKELFPDALVTTNTTGHDRDYDLFPYGSYRTNSAVLFPVSIADDRLHPKELVRGVEIAGKAVAFKYPNSGKRELITHTFQGADLVVVADESKDFIVSFRNTQIENTPLVFSLLNDQSSDAILVDQLGNEWNIFGTAISGPNTGFQLEVPYSYVGYWFSWSTFYPGIELFE